DQKSTPTRAAQHRGAQPRPGWWVSIRDRQAECGQSVKSSADHRAPRLGRAHRQARRITGKQPRLSVQFPFRMVSEA
ncbi:MAG: hypothetical protein DI537_34070, partial [Stutzerimonas stutzeri]